MASEGVSLISCSFFAVKVAATLHRAPAAWAGRALWSRLPGRNDRRRQGKDRIRHLSRLRSWKDLPLIGKAELEMKTGASAAS